MKYFIEEYYYDQVNWRMLNATNHEDAIKEALELYYNQLETFWPNNNIGINNVLYEVNDIIDMTLQQNEIFTIFRKKHETAEANQKEEDERKLYEMLKEKYG